MATKKNISAYFLLTIAFLFVTSDTYLTSASSHFPIVDLRANSSDQTQIYIVLVDPPSNDVELLGAEELEQYHLSFLPNTTLDSGEPRLIYSFRYAFTGFVARLTAEEVEAMEATDGFLSVLPDRDHKLATTYTPTFLGLEGYDGVWYKTKGEGIIIGVLDNGISQNHVSFDDNGMGTPPLKWRGCCEFNGRCNAYPPNNICNKKLLGARSLVPFTTPADDNGHGSHTAGTAAGNTVYGAEVGGIAFGTASGMAPLAHLATYKVCQAPAGCSSVYVAIALDNAIFEGVDVLSISLGQGPSPFAESPIAMGTFAAMEKGIFTSACAGNSEGPLRDNLENSAPWILTVGASTTDRRVVATLQLNNGMIFYGQSGYPAPKGWSTGMLAIEYPGLINQDDKIMGCVKGYLDKFELTGKIVICAAGMSKLSEMVEVVRAAGGVGIIILQTLWDGQTTYSDVLNITTIMLTHLDSVKLFNFLKTEPNPMGVLTYEGTQTGHHPAPAVGARSSVGPSRYNGGIIKPDILGPGVNILAPWHKQVLPNPTGPKERAFNFASGTSMSTPHLAGIAALLMSAHKNWSPAMIKSAIITTANALDKSGNRIVDERTVDYKPATFFQMGAGQVDPSAAYDPGLVYDIQPDDYIRYLCGLKYSDSDVTKITRRKNFNCLQFGKISAEQLNYPSIGLSLESTQQKVIHRTVTNVGDASSTYTAQVDEPDGVSVQVSPATLSFSYEKEKQPFSVTFTVKNTHPRSGEYSEGFLRWISNDNKHKVVSPISVKF